MSAMFRALRNPNYRLWAGGALVSNIGTWMQRVAQDWLVLTVLTDHSGTAVGITTALQFLPMLLLGPYAGVLADRYRKRSILLWTQSAMGLCALAVGLLVVTGSAQLWQVYAAALFLGLASAIDGPARQAFVSELVDQDDIANAVALNSASFNTARLTGPAIAGALIAWAGTGPIFLLNAASFVAVIISLTRIRASEPAAGTRAVRGKHQVAEGLGYVRQRPDLVLVLVLVAVLGAFGMNFAVTNALMATAEFGMGPGEFGILGSIMAVGTLAGALLAARRSRPRLRFLLGGVLGL
ncbi:MAG TPA: MFS transporter, partial [Arthrobacter sp.]|nr:MFS transporter [Arthrobacter sp.]